jgi:Protein of unknown function (DUF3363)
MRGPWNVLGGYGVDIRWEVERVGRQMASERGLAFRPSGRGEYVAGRLAGVANLTSGRFAMIEDGLGFQLVRLDRYISGVRRDDGGIRTRPETVSRWNQARPRLCGHGARRRQFPVRSSPSRLTSALSHGCRPQARSVR